MSRKTTYVPLTDLLTDIVDNRGKSVPTVEKGFPLIATNCIKHSSIYPTFENVRYVSDETLRTWFRSHLQPHDILFVNKGTPGRVCLVPDPVTFCAAQDMMGLRCNNERISYKYLFAVLRSNEIQKKIENNHVGLVIPHLRKQDLPIISIPIGNNKEDDDKIGNLYVTLSEKIELNNRINAELEAMAKTLYDYWFVQFDFPDKNGKPYKTSGGKMVWNRELKREIPEGWKEGTLGCFISLEYGKGLKADIRTGSGYPVIGSNGLVGYHSEYLVTGPGIVVGRKGTVGAITYVHNKFFPIDTTYYVKPIFDIEFRYLKFLLCSLGLEKMNSDSAVPGLNREAALRKAVVVPPKVEIQKFESIIAAIFTKQRNIMEENQHLSSLRDWLLPMLMNGQVKVS